MQRFWVLLLPVPMLIWPAVMNGYPLVFSDTGTYLSQAIHLYLGWDRPAFYSLFMMALHLTLTTWPVILAQAIFVILVLDCVRAAFFPAVPRAALPVLLLALSAAFLRSVVPGFFLVHSLVPPYGRLWRMAST